MKSVYMDHAATTPTDPQVLKAMTPYFTEVYGNPSSVYSLSRGSRSAIEEARGQVAVALSADPSEVYFTASGTEADNWALKGTMERMRAQGKDHLITTQIEHHAILHTAAYLEKVEGLIARKVRALVLTPEEYDTLRGTLRPEESLFVWGEQDEVLQKQMRNAG